MFAQSSLKSHIALRALLPSFSNRSRTDSWSFGIVEDPLLLHEMQQSVTLRHPPATTLVVGDNGKILVFFGKYFDQKSAFFFTKKSEFS